MKQIEKIIRKSDLAAQTQEDYEKIICKRDEFLPCNCVEEKEEVRFTYDTTGRTPFQEIKKERRDTILSSLIDCAKFIKIANEYQVDLHPENLFFDMHFRVCIMKRDVYKRGEEGDQVEFLRQYKALIGFALQKRYSYEDYVEGGLVLLSKDKFLAQIEKMERIEDITSRLEEEYEQWKEIYQNTMVLVKKKSRNRKRRVIVTLSGLLAVAIAIVGYWYFWLKPYEESVICANHAYMEKNYLGVIDSYKKVKLERLNVYDKYILAYSYIQCESLTGEQKENIMNALSLETNQKVLEYWIYLGQLDVKRAEDIAQQISQNDLLLYAYLKDKNMIENDTTISGAKKQNQIKSLEENIAKLSEDLQMKQDETENTDSVNP